MNEKCDRKVIWVIGENGNEGKSYFQEIIWRVGLLRSFYNGT